MASQFNLRQDQQGTAGGIKDPMNRPLAAPAVNDPYRADIQGGLTSAMSQLSPYMQGSQSAYDRFQQELLGTPTASNQLPGYESMLDARGGALEDLATGKAGMGKLFSGSTGQQAADIGGGMEQQLRDRYMQMLTGEVGAGRQMAGQAAGMEFGAGQNLANLGMQQQGFDQQAQQTADANKSGFWGDLLGAAGTIGGSLMGGPAGGAVGNWLGGLFSGGGGGGSAVGSGVNVDYRPTGYQQ